MPVLWTEAHDGKWLDPASAIFPDAACAADARLATMLMKDGCLLCAGVPLAVAELCLVHTPGAKQLSPAIARAHLKRRGRHPILQLPDAAECIEVSSSSHSLWL